MNERNGRVEVKVEGRMTVERAAEIRRMLLDALDSGDLVVVDLSGVTDIDAAGLQLLCSAHRTSIARTRGLMLEGVAQGAVGKVVGTAGFLRHAGCDADREGTCMWRGGL